MPEIAVTILGITGLLALVSLLPPVANRLNLPLLGAAGAGRLRARRSWCSSAGTCRCSACSAISSCALRGFEISPEALLYIFLPTLLFEAALPIDVRRLMDDVAPILLLAVVAVLVCTLVVGFALAGLRRRRPARLPAARRHRRHHRSGRRRRHLPRPRARPRRLPLLVEGESLFNDAAAIALFALLIGLLLGTGSGDGMVGTTLAFLKNFVGGGIFGYVAARGACALLALLRGLRLAEITLTVALAYLVYIVGRASTCTSPASSPWSSRGWSLGGIGRIRVTPTTWDRLVDTLGAARLLGQLADLPAGRHAGAAAADQT